MANILIGCECSGALRRLFREAGHNCWSCDLKPAEDGSEYHIQADIFFVLAMAPLFSGTGAARWDLFICHPDCTALTVAGNHVYAVGKPKHAQRLAAARWTSDLWDLSKVYALRVAFENPVGVLPRFSTLGKATQYVQPYDFGDDASKTTGWWLHGLPPLTGTQRIPGRVVWYGGQLVERWSNQTDSGRALPGQRIAPAHTPASRMRLWISGAGCYGRG